ncbi:TPA: DUF2325 domain-containing protein [Staphylococcus aureus]|nr:DUF2325 domain-containing protein [Staphylococcus aureus]HDH1976564.1 DUF2325 domain-containing protein [Staphylococcus aureus]HDY5190146.1 DUF2325 domain-containing protein [Staphylococcus aureus]HDY5793348.1 DUF2325 domain-containing protein [Staphylococcus aureus]
MEIENIIDTVKENWINKIRKTNDIEKLESLSSNYITILKSLTSISNTLSETDKQLDREQPIQHVESNHNHDFPIDLYVFQRRLRGGIATQNDESTQVTELVPESIVREEGLVNGDVIKIEKHYYSNNTHRFTKQNNIPRENVGDYPIVSYDNAIVTFDDTLQQYTIKCYYTDGGMKTTPQLIISNIDVERYGLKDGDVVDVAHQPNRSSVRVRWKYSTDELPYVKPRKASEYKENESTQMSIKDSIIKDKTIGVIGAESYIQSYTEEVEKRKGNLIHTDSEVKGKIENLVNQSDIVVIPIFEVGHIKMDLAKHFCKELDIPYLILRSNGRSNFIMSIEKYLSNNEN